MIQLANRRSELKQIQMFLNSTANSCTLILVRDFRRSGGIPHRLETIRSCRRQIWTPCWQKRPARKRFTIFLQDLIYRCIQNRCYPRSLNDDIDRFIFQHDTGSISLGYRVSLLPCSLRFLKYCTNMFYLMMSLSLHTAEKRHSQTHRAEGPPRNGLILIKQSQAGYNSRIVKPIILIGFNSQGIIIKISLKIIL